MNPFKIISQKIQDGEKLEDIKKLILQVYELISDKRGKDSVAKKFASIKDSLLKESLVHETIRFNLTIPPFTSATFEDMKRAAKLLDIPLNEKVYIPELGSWTSEAVPVGIQYFSVLEQLSSDYESTRSTAGYVSATGQPTVGKSRVGGQSLGELDLYNLLTYDAHNVLKELLMARSDNLNDKRELIGNLREYGVSNAPKGDKTGATSKLFNIFMVGQGLWI